MTGAAQVYAALGIEPLPGAGRAWLMLDRMERERALMRARLHPCHARADWRELPDYVRDRLAERYARRT